MENISSQVGNRIRQIRRLKDMSQETLALNSGLNTSFLSDIERGKKKPSVESLEKLLMGLDITFQEFFSFEKTAENLDGETALDKLTQKLHRCSDMEIEKIYKIVKHVLDFKLT